ncbi:MAG: EamA family transporter [Thermoanaerobaculia bacterium]
MLRSSARFQILAAALLFSTGGAAIKLTALSSWQVASFRSAVAFLALLVMLPEARRGWTWRSAAVGVAYAGALICYAVANKLTTAASAIFLQSTAPLYIIVLGPWLLKEPNRRRDLALAGALVLGLCLLFSDTCTATVTAPNPLAGNLLAAGAGLSWAFAVVGLRWMSRGGVESNHSAGPAVAIGNLIAFLVCLPMAFPMEEYGAANDWLIIVFLGVLQIGLAYVFLTAGLRRITALEASLLLLVEPVLNPIWVWLTHGEVPGVRVLVGGLVIVTATAARVLSDRLFDDVEENSVHLADDAGGV